MRINRRRILTTLLLACALTTMADDRNVTFHFSDGSSQSVALESLRKLTFSNDNVVAHLEDGTTEKAFSIANLQYFVFKQSATAIEKPAVAADAVRVAISNSAITLVGYDADKPLPAALYDAQGVMRMRSKALGSNTVDISSLPKGLYIFKIGTQIFKLYK